MLKDLKIGTWNLCLGLQNKRDLVVSTLTECDVSIWCLQECEIPVNFPERILNSGKYTLELELNDEKKRVGIYIKNGISYTRRCDLEAPNISLSTIFSR